MLDYIDLYNEMNELNNEVQGQFEIVHFEFKEAYAAYVKSEKGFEYIVSIMDNLETVNNLTNKKVKIVNNQYKPKVEGMKEIIKISKTQKKLLAIVRNTIKSLLAEQFKWGE